MRSVQLRQSLDHAHKTGGAITEGTISSWQRELSPELMPFHPALAFYEQAVKHNFENMTGVNLAARILENQAPSEETAWQLRFIERSIAALFSI